MLELKKFEIFTRGDPRVGISKIDIFIRGEGPLCWNFKDQLFYKEHSYIPLKLNIISKMLKKRRVICRELK